MLIDGNLAETLIEHGPASGAAQMKGEPARLVGVDQHGNKYFEKPGAQWGERADERTEFACRGGVGVDQQGRQRVL